MYTTSCYMVCIFVVTMVTGRTAATCRQNMESSAPKITSGAPLARMESYEDDEYDDGVIKVTVTFDDEEPESIVPVVHPIKTDTEIRKKSSPSIRLRAKALHKRVTKKQHKTTVEGESSVDDERRDSNEFLNQTTGVSSDSSSKSPVFTNRDDESDVTRIRFVIDHVMSYIEEHGILTEGLYRKSGTQSKVKKLHRKLLKASSSKDNSLVDLATNASDIHVLTSAFKSLLREMKDPIVTRDLHPFFMDAVGDSIQEQERELILNDLILRLPTENKELLERLIVHLMRVAAHEEANRMSAEALAIIFAPNIMSLQTQEQLTIQSICYEKQQARCLQYIIESRMKKINSGNFDELDCDSTMADNNDAVDTDKTLQDSPVSTTSEYMSTDWSWNVRLEERADWSWSVKLEEKTIENDKQEMNETVSHDGMPITTKLDDVMSQDGSPPTLTELPLVRTISDYVTNTRLPYDSEAP